MSRREIAGVGTARACYFRSSTAGTDRKALIQITERCNLHCAHCFVSATREGIDMDAGRIEAELLPRLAEARVSRVTLTGGEPFAHPDLEQILLACRERGLGVTICTNATLISEEQIVWLASEGGVRLNVSLDGFSAKSHGRFRGSPHSFATTISTMEALGEVGLLKGVLVTPNRLADGAEYEELCSFAATCGAEYVLMNPLSSLGRGVAGIKPLGASEEMMRAIALDTAPAEFEVELVRVRFPNDKGRPLSACEAGRILYVFADGSLTICPYLIFAARTPGSQHDPREFLVGNAFDDPDIALHVDQYPLARRVALQSDPTCSSCGLASACGRGCPAAVIASGGTVGERDREQCPIEDTA